MWYLGEATERTVYSSGTLLPAVGQSVLCVQSVPSLRFRHRRILEGRAVLAAEHTVGAVEARVGSPHLWLPIFSIAWVCVKQVSARGGCITVAAERAVAPSGATPSDTVLVFIISFVVPHHVVQLMAAAPRERVADFIHLPLGARCSGAGPIQSAACC